MTILRVYLRRSLALEPEIYETLPPSDQFSVQELPGGHELDTIAKQIAGCPSWNIFTYKGQTSETDPVPDADVLPPHREGRDGIINRTLQIRIRLSEMGGASWRGETSNIASRVAETIDSLMNIIWASAGDIPATNSQDREITWSVDVGGVTEAVYLKIERKYSEDRLTPWETNPAVVDAMLSLWISHLSQLRPAIPENGNNLWLVNISRDKDGNVGRVLCDWWIARDVDSVGIAFPADDNVNSTIPSSAQEMQNLCATEKIHQSRILNCVPKNPPSSYPVVQGFIKRTPLSHMCAQYILSSFLTTIATYMDPVSIQKTKVSRIDSPRCFKCTNSDLEQLANAIERSGLASFEDAYRIIIPALYEADKLPDILSKDLRILELAGGSDGYNEVRDQMCSVWISRNDAMTLHQNRWADAGNYYKEVERTFSETLGSDDPATLRLRSSMSEFVRLQATRIIDSQASGSSKIPTILPNDSDALSIRSSAEDDGTQSSPASRVPRSGNVLNLFMGGVFNDSNWAIVHWAAKEGNDMLGLILKTGTDPNTRDTDERTIAHYAAKDGHDGIVRVLMEHSADLNARDKDDTTAVHWASGGGHEGIVRLLLQGGVDLEAMDVKDKTALGWAVEGGHEEIVKILADGGADLSKTDQDGRTALHLAAELGQCGLVKVLVDKGADLHKTDSEGLNALHWAARMGHPDAVSLLLKMGVDFRVQDETGKTAKQWAILKGRKDIAALFPNL